MSQRVGVGVERLQEWGYAAVQAGASQETLEDALKDFGKHMTEIATGDGHDIESSNALRTLLASR